jgi:hypothetical protein
MLSPHLRCQLRRNRCLEILVTAYQSRHVIQAECPGLTCLSLIGDGQNLMQAWSWWRAVLGIVHKSGAGLQIIPSSRLVLAKISPSRIRASVWLCPESRPNSSGVPLVMHHVAKEIDISPR